MHEWGLTNHVSHVNPHQRHEACVEGGLKAAHLENMVISLKEKEGKFEVHRKGEKFADSSVTFLVAALDEGLHDQIETREGNVAQV